MKAKITHRSLRLVPVILALALGLFTVIGPAHAMHPNGVINDTWDGVAIKGYDPVAYFTMGQAVKGSEEFVHEWLETKWLFVNAEHRDLFAADPLSYVPQYGGYCSDATFVDDKADVNPTAWRIVSGRLYLFYSEPGAATWSEDDYAVKKADAAWEHVKAGLAQ
jgi:hypothetical protein